MTSTSVLMNRLLRETEFTRDDVSRLAFMNWEKDGCPRGRDLDYWLEAEQQLKATWHLLARECRPNKSRKAPARKPSGHANVMRLNFAAHPKAA